MAPGLQSSPGQGVVGIWRIKKKKKNIRFLRYSTPALFFLPKPHQKEKNKVNM
jgi:hypothetical protein